jgi:PAS domain S-box-containing protein
MNQTSSPTTVEGMPVPTPLGDAPQPHGSAAYYRTVFESTSDAVMLLDEAGFFDCNAATLRVFGCETREQFLEHHPSEFSPPEQPGGLDSRSAAAARIRQAFAQGRASFEWLHRRLDGQTFPADVLLTRVKLPERPALVAVVRDISERKLAEEAIRESSEALHEAIAHSEKARAEAESANRTKSQFLANISHELRTPLHAILSFAEFGLRSDESLAREQLLDYFRDIRTSGQQLLALVDDLLDLAQFEAGNSELHLEHVDMILVVLSAVEQLEPAAQQRGLTIDVAEIDWEPVVLADRDTMSQLVHNLLDNAIRFSLDGGRIDVAFALDEHGQTLRIDVCDRGVGIPAAERESVFDKFSQSSKTDSGAGGTGLGLALCREIVAIHHGAIWADENPGGGAKLSVRLPLAVADTQNV